MKWQSHIIIGGAFGAVINPILVPVAVLGATAPDWLEYILKFFGIRVQHRGVTHYVVLWLIAIAFFALAWDYRLIGLGFAIGGFSHVIGDSFTISGVPFAPWSDAKFHLFGGKLRTGGAGEYIVAGIIVVLCAGWIMYSPVKVGTAAQKESGFIPFFYDWKNDYEKGLIDGREWKDNRMKFL
jgi:Predicted membrane-bound metal-dependent hydrolases